jgi:hypothetical protein
MGLLKLFLLELLNILLAFLDLDSASLELDKSPPSLGEYILSLLLGVPYYN